MQWDSSIMHTPAGGRQLPLVVWTRHSPEKGRMRFWVTFKISEVRVGTVDVSNCTQS